MRANDLMKQRAEALTKISQAQKIISKGRKTRETGEEMYAEGTALLATDRAEGNELRRKARAWITEGRDTERRGILLQDEGQRQYDEAAEALGLWKEEL